MGEPLLSDSRTLAIKPLSEIFKRFGWNTSEQVIKEIQAELKR